jgi:DnaK suppressor protein
MTSVAKFSKRKKPAEPKRGGKNPLRKAFLKEIKKTLLEMKKKQLHEIRRTIRDETAVEKDDGRDTYDLASDERDREIHLILSDREREKLQAIEEALRRIEEKTYGICETCEAEIADGRLRVMPFSRACVNCQTEMEKENKLSRKFDEERAYRKLGVSDLEEDNF